MHEWLSLVVKSSNLIHGLYNNMLWRIVWSRCGEHEGRGEGSSHNTSPHSPDILYTKRNYSECLSLWISLNVDKTNWYQVRSCSQSSCVVWMSLSLLCTFLLSSLSLSTRGFSVIFRCWQLLAFFYLSAIPKTNAVWGWDQLRHEIYSAWPCYCIHTTCVPLCHIF